MARRKRLNRTIIEHNLSEAIEELDKLRDRAARRELKEEELQIGLLHAYHHLNFAWNIRYVPTSEYASLTQSQFNRWGKYPSGIEKL